MSGHTLARSLKGRVSDSPHHPAKGNRAGATAAEFNRPVRRRTPVNLWPLLAWTSLHLAAEPGNGDSRIVVSALGRLEPAGGVIHVAAPNSIQGTPVLGELLVREGQSVTNAQPLALTHTHAAARAAWMHSTRLVEAARARLAQAEAGVKPAELAVLEAGARRDLAELEDARRDLQRTRELRSAGASSQQALDAAETLLLTRSYAVEAANRRLAAGREVRAEDVAVARAEVEVAVAQAQRAHDEWQQTIVRAPHPGRLLAIHARTGEAVGTDGLLDLGDTDHMTVKTEVYETDIRHVRPGQRAEVTGEAFPGTLPGQVERVGLQVVANRLLKPDPSEFTDSRIVEVMVRLDDSAAVRDLTGALVNVRILP